MENRGNARWRVVVAVLAPLLVAGTGAAYVASYAVEKTGLSKDLGRCRRIVTALHIYAMDHDGKYPDAFLTNPQSSNEVFRPLLKEGAIADEMDFGSMISPYVPTETSERNPSSPRPSKWERTTGP